MIKTPVHLQDLRRRIYRKAKSEATHRFWGLFVHIAKMETLEEAVMPGGMEVPRVSISKALRTSRLRDERPSSCPYGRTLQIIKVGGKIGVPQGGPFSPLAANIYLNELNWTFDAIRRKTAQGPYEAVNYHRFADDIVITVSGHRSKRGWAERARQRLQEQLTPLGVELNKEKTKVVDTLKGEAFGFLGLICAGYGNVKGTAIISK
jgi:hypothetical protein